MDNLRKTLNVILNFLAGASFILMVAFTCWQVFTRYILKNPSAWSEELVSFLFAWMSLLGASLVTGERGHMNIPAAVEKMGEKQQKCFHIFAEAVALLFSLIILVYGGIKISVLAMGQLTSSLGVAVGIFYIVMPLCGIVNIIFTILNIIEISRGKEV